MRPIKILIFNRTIFMINLIQNPNPESHICLFTILFNIDLKYSYNLKIQTI